ncbi:MAG: carbohydrate kinase, partial [Chitinophagaceae bacterium]
INDIDIQAGIGLHDSSAAIIPYLHLTKEPFLLISTGTWCISLNPFNNHPLTEAELKKDCLCYLTHSGKSVKASRLFAGKWHEEQVLKMATHFHLKPEYFSAIKYRPEIIKQETGDSPEIHNTNLSSFDPNQYSSADIAYHFFMYQLVKLQAASTNLVLINTEIDNIYIDGGFSKNEVFMYLMSAFFPSKHIYAASIAQASTFGAAMIMHHNWNDKPIPDNLVNLYHYTVKNQ